MMEDSDNVRQDEFKERPWIVLSTTYDVEAWIDQFNRDLQLVVKKPQANRHGICFRLAHGGELFLHTSTEGDVLLDVPPEAAWVMPVIVAATGCNPPASQIWPLPGERLTELLLGLNSLIEASRIVTDHDFRIRKNSWRENSWRDG